MVTALNSGITGIPGPLIIVPSGRFGLLVRNTFLLYIEGENIIPGISSSS